MAYNLSYSTPLETDVDFSFIDQYTRQKENASIPDDVCAEYVATTENKTKEWKEHHFRVQHRLQDFPQQIREPIEHLRRNLKQITDELHATRNAIDAIDTKMTSLKATEKRLTKKLSTGLEKRELLSSEVEYAQDKVKIVTRGPFKLQTTQKLY